ncbi:MAG: EAL domain-containing protein [Wolinella sp.]
MIKNGTEQDFFKSFRVLLVEDELEVLEIFATFLRRRFQEVYLAKNGKEGLEAFKQHSPDFVMTDVVMPELDGLAMSKKIKELNPNTPIIIITAHDDSDLLAKAIQIGIDGYILKPVNDRTLVKTIKRALSGIHYTRAQKDIQEKDTLINIVADNSPVGICLLSENEIIYANKSLESIIGYSKSELLAGSLLKIVQGACSEIFEEIGSSLECIGCTTRRYLETRVKTKAGKVRYVDISVNSVEFQGRFVAVVNMIDVTDKKWFKEELEHSRAKLEELNRELKHNMQVIQQKNRLLEEQLYVDKLTSLPNRTRLLEDLKLASSPFLILLNIDSFKEVNDFYGTEVGDFVLKEIAKRLLNYNVQSRFKLYKLQADEYALLDPKCPSSEDLESLSARIHREVDSHLIFLKEQEIHIQISAGMCYGDSDSVLTRADIALKLAKKRNKPYLIYNDTMKVMKEYEENFRWIRMLKNALNEHRIVCYFQPVFDNQTRKIYKFECLARLIGEDGKVYPPFFIDISKKARLYHRITRAIVADACRTFKDLDCEFSINVSIDDILNSDTVEYITSEVQRHGVANRIFFEILESEGIDNYEIVDDFIQRMKRLGCSIAIDDFGSGYSNFAHILRLNVDVIKIDASIIKNSDSDRNSQIIAQTIVEFSKRLGIKTVAEFVHSKEVFEMIKGFGVDYSQGYYISEPSRKLVMQAPDYVQMNNVGIGGGGGSYPLVSL